AALVLSIGHIPRQKELPMPYPILRTSTANKSAPNNPSRFYVASDIKQKRFRRTKLEVTRIRDAIHEILEGDNPQTVRQVFYALTVRGVIKKAEIEYQRTVVRLLVEMREAGNISFGWIADNTRWMRKPATFVGLEACLRVCSVAHDVLLSLAKGEPD